MLDIEAPAPPLSREKRLTERNSRAYQRHNGGDVCVHCGHDEGEHLVVGGQPHFFHAIRGRVVKKYVVDRSTDVIALYCEKCAGGLGTGQVVCYQRSTGTGETVRKRRGRKGGRRA